MNACAFELMRFWTEYDCFGLAMALTWDREHKKAVKAYGNPTDWVCYHHYLFGKKLWKLTVILLIGSVTIIICFGQILPAKRCTINCDWVEQKVRFQMTAWTKLWRDNRGLFHQNEAVSELPSNIERSASIYLSCPSRLLGLGLRREKKNVSASWRREEILKYGSTVCLASFRRFQSLQLVGMNSEKIHVQYSHSVMSSVNNFPFDWTNNFRWVKLNR